jgi:hypothetical protein
VESLEERSATKVTHGFRVVSQGAREEGRGEGDRWKLHRTVTGGGVGRYRPMKC